jgi:hypothetical protein
MRDGLAAGDRVQLHINNGRNKAYPQRPGLDQALSRGSVGRFLSRPGEVCFWHKASVARCEAMSGVGGRADLPVECPDFSL